MDSTKRSFLLRGSALAASLMVSGCGGGGGGGSSAPAAAAPAPVTPPVTPPVVTPPAPVEPVVTPTTISFAEIAVHDPSVIKAGDSYYVFGSHLSAAKTTDLMNWTRVADGVTDANPLFTNVTSALSEALSWAQTTTLWAPDVHEIDGKFYFYYNACKGDSPRSALGVAVADKVDGPYVNKQVFLKSGMNNTTEGLSADGTAYDSFKHPNTVDPQVFNDTSGKLWMVYGSYSGGIFILAMDKATGLPLAGQGYGKHIMGGNHARIEGAYILYSPQSQFYYLFTSFGGLDSSGGYNVRVARSTNPDGPYVDAKGTDMATVKGVPPTIFDDASITPHGQKLMGSHQFALAAGETGTALGYVSPGHNSALYDPVTKKYFIIFHTRFPTSIAAEKEFHQVRVHEFFINADGWPVIAPLRYAPLAKSAVALSDVVTAADAAGSYQVINHGKDISAVIKTAQNIKLNGDGTVSGAISGTWAHKGSNNITLSLGTTGNFSGVVSRQYNTNAKAFVVTFTAQSAEGVSLWALRTGA